MANIFTTSIGKKLIMSISGLFLVLFLLLHATINALYIVGPEAFQAGVEFMSLPIVTIFVPILAAGFAIHIIYGLYLTLYNRKARGNNRYEVANKAATDSWSSKNMFVLGLVVLGVLMFHLTHFWAKMQLLEFMGSEAEDANMLMETIFRSPINLAIYLIWFVALWFHLTHGFWSAFHTVGLNNRIWIKRLKVISYIYATLVVCVFIAIALVAFMRANNFCGFC